MSTVNLDTLLAVLNKNKDVPLVFYKDGTAILAGYHVTEVKQASIKSLDCGSGTDQWDEIIVQLFDGSHHSSKGHMSASTFVGIMESALNSPTLERDAKLYFEFGLQNSALEKLQATSLKHTASEIRVDLQSETAVCKPFQRAKAGLTGDSTAAACCGSTTVNSDTLVGSAGSQCCGNGTDQSQNNACCD